MLRTESSCPALALAESLAQRFAARARQHGEHGFPHENHRDLHEQGYLRLLLPRDHGGTEAGLVEMVQAQERLARGDAATALITAMAAVVMGKLREERPWPEEVFAEVCEAMLRQGGGINSCVTEPELGSISRGGIPRSRATPVPGGWVVEGHKIFVTGAPALRWFLTAVVLPPSSTAPDGEVATAIVAAGSPGLRIVETWNDALSLRGCGNSDVFYDKVFVPERMMVERRPVGTPSGSASGKASAPGLGPWSLTVAAVYLGVGQAALEAACDYANNRVPTALGRPIAEQVHIQQRVGEMQAALLAARALLHETARAWVEQPELRPTLPARIAAAKYLCTNAACAASESGLRVAGGFSLTSALSLERHFRDARAGLFQPPQDDLALGVIGRDALAQFRRKPA
jgi:alkylation response protein AidB-like acyl-CoA dehydrogenase